MRILKSIFVALVLVLNFYQNGYAQDKIAPVQIATTTSLEARLQKLVLSEHKAKTNTFNSFQSYSIEPTKLGDQSFWKFGRTNKWRCTKYGAKIGAVVGLGLGVIYGGYELSRIKGDELANTFALIFSPILLMYTGGLGVIVGTLVGGTIGFFSAPKVQVSLNGNMNHRKKQEQKIMQSSLSF